MAIKATGQTKKSVIFWVFAFLAVGILVGGLYLVFDKTVMEKYNAKINELNGIVNLNTHDVYVAYSEILAGEVVTSDKVYVDTVLMTNTNDLLTRDDIGKIALVDIGAGSVMYKKDVAEPDNSEPTDRLTELSCFFLPQNVREGSYIDVRIRFQTGEDFVVLAKKRIEKVSASGATCFVSLDEHECQLISSAIIDMKNWSATIYANTYTNATVQDESLVTYVPNTQTLDVLNLFSLVDAGDMEMYTQYRVSLDNRLAADYNARKEGSLASLDHTDIRNTTEYDDNEIDNTGDQGADGNVSGEQFDFDNNNNNNGSASGTTN